MLDEVRGDRQLVIEVGSAEAFSLAATLGGIQWGRPMTYQVMARLVESPGGRVGQVRIARLPTQPWWRPKGRSGRAWWTPGPVLR